MAQTIRFNRKHTVPPDHDPYRRLIAAVAFFAAKEYLYPPRYLSKRDRASAALFCTSNTGQDIFQSLGISPTKINAIIGERS